MVGGAAVDYNRPDAGQYSGSPEPDFQRSDRGGGATVSGAMMGQPIHLQAYLPFCELNLAFPGHREVTSISAGIGSGAGGGNLYPMKPTDANTPVKSSVRVRAAAS